MTEPSYTYRATVLSVYDGDTITVQIDCGFDITIKQKVRLLGINTPEIRGEERELGLKARNYLRELILRQNVIIKTEKDKTGKYGRLLGTIYLGEMNINEHLINEGFAKPY